MKWLKRYKKLVMESVFVVGLVCIAALSERVGKNPAEVLVTPAAESQPLETQEQEIPGDGTELKTQIVEETGTPKESPVESPVVLSEKQIQLLKDLEQQLEEGNLEGAARMLIDKEQQFVSLFYTTLEGKDYLCSNGAVTDEIEGIGLVFQKPGTLFYGSFQNGLPEGTLTAMQAIDLGTPRYDYSVGTWSDGFMEGDGTIGYRFYGEVEENMPKEVKKEGHFTGDLMDGAIVYTSVDQDDGQLVWNIEAALGVTVLSENWSYNEAEDAYQLITESDKTAAYTLEKQDAESIRWLNLISWAR